MDYATWKKSATSQAVPAGKKEATFDKNIEMFKGFSAEDKALYENLNSQLVVEDYDVQKQIPIRQAVMDAPANVRQRLLEDKAARLKVAAERKAGEDFQTKRAEVEAKMGQRESLVSKDAGLAERVLIGFVDKVMSKGEAQMEMEEVARPEYLIAAQAEEKSLEYSLFEENLLSGKLDSVVDTAKFGQYSAHKSIGMSAAIMENRWDEVDTTQQRLSAMEEAAEVTLPEGETWVGKGALGALQSSAPMAESIALGAVSFGTVDKAYWAMMGQGEIVHTYLSETGKKMSEMSPKERQRLQTISSLAGGLYGATEQIGSMYGAQKAGSFLRKRAFGKLTKEAVANPTLLKKIGTGGAKFIWEWLKENAEEGVQGFIVDAAVQEQDGEFIFEEAWDTGIDQFVEAAPSTMFMVGGGKVASVAGKKAFQLGSPEEVLDREVKKEVSQVNKHLAVATEQTTAEFTETLAAMPVTEMLDKVRELSLPIETGTREEMTQLLIDNVDKMSFYQERRKDNFTKTLTADKSLTNLARNEMKWLAQGDIQPEQIASFRTVMERVIANSDYEGDLEMFMDERLSLTSDNGYMEFNQLSTPEVMSWLGQEIVINSELSGYVANRFAAEPNLQDWFTGSTEHIAGKPLIYYHGSSFGMDTFNSRPRIAGHYTLSPLTAAGFARVAAFANDKAALDPKVKEKEDMGLGRPSAITDREGMTLYPVILSVKNPFDYRDKGQLGRLKAILDRVQPEGNFRVGITIYSASDELINELGQNGSYRIYETQTVRDALDELGHDSYYEKENDYDTVPNIAVFDAENVKSIFNDGKWDRQSKLMLHQVTGSGDTKTRGVSHITAEGKFVIDLLATGDILTLAHEFAHVASPYMTESMVDAIIQTTLKNNPAANKGLEVAKRNTYKRIWTDFASDPALANAMTPQMQEMLRDLQETLAYNFENYLVTETAPVAELNGAFKMLHKRYIEYYRDIRKLPVKYQKVDPVLASAFDKMLAKDEILIKPAKREVTLYDAERKTDVRYVLEESRGRNAAHRELLKYIERGFAKLSGLHEQLEIYAAESLGSLTTAERNAIALVRGRKDAIKYVDNVDIRVAKEQEKARKDAIKAVRKSVKRLTNLKTSKGESGVLREAYIAGEALLVDIDTDTRTTKRRARAQRLKVAEAIAKKTGELPPELRHATDKELKDLANADKYSVYDMSLTELANLQEAIDDILGADTERQKNHSKQQLLKDKIINDKVNTELTGNWRYKKQSRKVLSTEINNLAERVLKPLNGLTRRQSVNFAAFSNGENSFLYGIFRKLEQGRELQDTLSKVWMQKRWAIFSNASDKGISEGLRKKVATEAKVVTQLQTESGAVTAELTVAELMMVYGYAKNSKLRRGLYKHGLKLEAMPNKLLKFDSEESIQTLASRLDPTYQAIVDKTIDMYQNDIYPILSKMFFKVTGVELRQEDYYLPTFREWQGRGNMEFFDLASLGGNDAAWMRQHIGSLSFLNVRKPGDQAFYIRDFFTSVEENQESSAFYTGMADPIRNIRVQLIASENVEGTAAYKYKVMMGPEYKRFKQWVDRIEKRATQYDDITSKFSKWSNRGRKGILKASVPISVAQIFSVKGCQNYGTTRKELITALGKQTFRSPKIIDNLKALDPMFWHRFQHPPMIEMGITSRQAATRNGWIPPKSWAEMAMDVSSWSDLVELAAATEEGMLFTIKYMDAYALTVQWEAIQLQRQREGWTESQTLEHFKKVVRRTQPMQDPLYTSSFLSTENSFLRLLFGPFRSQRDAYLGEAQLNAMELQNNKAGQGKGVSSWVLASRMNRALITSSIVFSLAKAAMSSLLQGRDDDDPLWKNVLYRTITNTLALLPIAGDLAVGTINITTQSYGGLVPDYIPAQLGETFLRKGVQAKKAMERGDEELAIRYSLEAASSLTASLGSAAGNVIKLGTDYMKKLTRNEGKANGNRLYR